MSSALQRLQTFIIWTVSAICMISSILTVIILLWLTLAVAVGFHAKGHNRSGIIWFCVVTITGIFGLAFYLLAITSADPEESDTNPETDKKIIRNAPLVVLGFFAGLGISFAFVALLYYTLPIVTRPESFYGLMFLSGLVGAGSGPYLYSRVKNIVESRINIAGYFASTSVNLSRRKTLGLVGGGATLLIGGIVYNFNPEPPKPDLSMTETTVQHNEDGGVVIVNMNNPRSEPVTVQVDAWVQVVEVQKTIPSHQNSYETGVVETATISPEETKEIQLTYEPDEAFRLDEFELDDGEEPSFSIEGDDK